MAEALRRRTSNQPRALIGVAGVMLEALPEGALWWADERLLVVADLHLEKGSSFARRGQLLPPYDTLETLRGSPASSHGSIRRSSSRSATAFTTMAAPRGSPPRDRAALAALQSGRDWIWIAGNHDRRAARRSPAPMSTALAIGPLLFRHEPAPVPARARSPAISTRPPASSAAAARCAAAASPATATASSCRPSAPMPAASTSSTAPSPASSPAPTFRAFMLGDDRVYPVGTAGAPSGLSLEPRALVGWAKARSAVPTRAAAPRGHASLCPPYDAHPNKSYPRPKNRSYTRSPSPLAEGRLPEAFVGRSGERRFTGGLATGPWGGPGEARRHYGRPP